MISLNIWKRPLFSSHDPSLKLAFLICPARCLSSSSSLLISFSLSYLFTFYLKYLGWFQPNLANYTIRQKGIYICLNEGPSFFGGEDNLEVTTCWYFWKIFFLKTFWCRKAELNMEPLRGSVHVMIPGVK